MEFTVQLFFILLVSGLILLGAEIYVPGGVLGAAGVLAILLSVIVSFSAFGALNGAYVAFGVIVLMGVAIALWIKLFPGSRFGRRMTVETDLKLSKGTQSGLADLVGKQGQAASALRPSGFAVLDGKRVDVITQGEMLDKGTPVVVVRVEANRVVVRRR
jgi:membrane-bound serine protease (ClpP class)